MAKASGKKSKSKAKPKGKPKPFLARTSVRIWAGGLVGLGIVGMAAVAVFAWSPGDAPPSSTDVAALTIPARKPPPKAELAVPRLEPRPAPSVDPAPQPSAPPVPAEEEPPAPAAKPLPPAPSGTPPWQRFARPASTEPGPRVAIVIDDAGLDHYRTARVIGLPGPLTIAFLTYGEGLVPQVRAAASAGHELIVHVAMEATSRAMDPGPDVLLRDIEPDEILARLTRVLGKFNGYVGINNHMGSLFTADRAAMQVVLGEVKRRGLLFLDSRTGPNTVGGEVARALDVPFAGRDVFLDNEPVVSAVNRQLAEVERIARARGQAVAIGHPRDATIEALAKWIPEARDRGLVFVPISAIVKNNVARDALSARSN